MKPVPEPNPNHKTAQHTPGPWFVEAVSDAVRVCVRLRKHTAEERYTKVILARLAPPQLPEDETGANALLIAAAPELLEALKSWERWYSEDSSEYNRELAREAGRAAIAKAEGR